MEEAYMTKEQIIEALKANARPNEIYCLDDEVRQAMMQLSNPGELVEPILEIIGENPTVDFGMPGDLVHFVECFYRKGYEELLIASVRKNPTAQNIWMVHRCYNDTKNPYHKKFEILTKELREDSSVSTEIKNAIDEFSW